MNAESLRALRRGARSGAKEHEKRCIEKALKELAKQDTVHTTIWFDCERLTGRDVVEWCGERGLYTNAPPDGATPARRVQIWWDE